MQTKRFISGILASMMLFSSFNIANAEGVLIDDAGDNGNTLLYVDQESSTFDVIVPLHLTVHLNNDGTVTTADNVVITNKSYGPVKVVDIDAIAKNDWKLLDFLNVDLSSLKVDSKQIGLAISEGTKDNHINDSYTNETELVFGGIWSAIPGMKKGTTPKTQSVYYDAKINAVSQAIETAAEVADVIFTIDWHMDGDDIVIENDIQNSVQNSFQSSAPLNSTQSAVLDTVINSDKYIEDMTYVSLGDLMYYVNGYNKITIAGFSVDGALLSNAALEIPDKINGIVVMAIGTDAFKNCVNLVNVTLPSSITRISTGAFVNCSNLTTVKMPQSLINTYATSTYFGDNVDNIEFIAID